MSGCGERRVFVGAELEVSEEEHDISHDMSHGVGLRGAACQGNRRGCASTVLVFAAVIGTLAIFGRNRFTEKPEKQFDLVGATQKVEFLPLLTVKRYGVLGTQMKMWGQIERAATSPGSDVVLIDPAGWRFIQQFGPSGAGGASGAIYKWLGIQGDLQFPMDVRQKIRASGDAAFHRYGNHAVIHVASPDLAKLGTASAATERLALDQLAKAYMNVLLVFLELSAFGVKVLRMLPISGGIFSGDFQQDLARLTFKALEQGFNQLPPQCQIKIRSSGFRLEMCIWKESDAPRFEAAYAFEINRGPFQPSSVGTFPYAPAPSSVGTLPQAAPLPVNESPWQSSTVGTLAQEPQQSNQAFLR